jgi:hypothetical protein
MNIVGFLWSTVENIYYLFFPNKMSTILLLKNENEILNDTINNNNINSHYNKVYSHMKSNTANTKYIFVFDDERHDNYDDIYVGGVW